MARKAKRLVNSKTKMTLGQWRKFQDAEVQAVLKAEDAALAELALQNEAPNIRKQVLRSADQAVNGSRDVAYGSPETNFKRIARLWNAHLLNRYENYQGHGSATVQLDEGDVAIFLGLVKDGRLAGNMSHMDSWIDKAGYAACGAEVTNK